MTATETLMMRLGIILSGSNDDLGPLPQEDDSDGDGSDDDNDPEDGDDDKDSDGSGSDDDEDSDDEDGDGSDDEDGDGSDDDNDEDSDEDGDGSDRKGSKGDDDGDSDDGDSDDSDEDGDEDSDEDSDEDGDEDGDEGDSKDQKGKEGGKGDSKDQKGKEGGKGGGHSHVEEPEAIDEEEIAQALLNGMEDGDENGLVDNNEALSEAVDGEADKEEVLKNEAPWRPYRPDLDEVKFVRTTSASAPAAKQMLETVRRQVSFLKAKMRAKFLAARQPRTMHGVRKGMGLSERRLVNSMVELKSGRRPTRPDWTKENRDECSLAVALVIDESGSMSRLRVDAARSALAIASAMDVLGCPCLVVGPRDGAYDYHSGGYGGYNNSDWNDKKGNPKFHRSSQVIIDVFKDWTESMLTALPRFGNVQATGGTPLSDGIQYALQELNGRPERHRVVLVITDGAPNCTDVVRRQIRIAAEAGVQVVGVGISSGCSAVKRLFPLHVAVTQVDRLAEELLKILDSIMFPKRGRKINLQGPRIGR